MGTQVSYPGIYVQEFTPGAPIQGVGTSTAAFIGMAKSGPINQPTLITSWDEFKNVFGGFIADEQERYLAPAVYGFFQNRGTTCYIVRASVAKNASADLPVRDGSGQTDLTATSIAEGVIGNSTSIQVIDSSRLASMLAAAKSTDTTLTLAHGKASITAFDGTKLTLSGLSGDFAAGDKVVITGGGPAVKATVASFTAGPPVTALLSVPVPSPGTYVGGSVRIDDLQVGQLTFRVVVPPSLVVNQALPGGALINISLPGTDEDVTVVSSGGGVITLNSGLTNSYSMTGPTFPEVASLEFDLIVAAATTETFSHLSMNPLHPGYWRTAVKSRLIALSLPTTPPTGPLPNPQPQPGTYPLLLGADDDREKDRDNINKHPNDYLDLLVPLQDVDIVAIPGFVDPVPQQALVNHCETLFNRFAILDGPQKDNPAGFPDLLTQYGQVRTPDGFAALYFPWIQVVNPLSGLSELWPPSGHIAGIYARIDHSRGVHKAPANAAVAGALGVPYLLSDADQGPLNLLGINILRVFPEQSQPLVWGARTTSTDSNWQYVNIRRLFIYLEQSIERGIRWAIFEPNNKMLWGKLKRSITDFLNRAQADGGIISFYVRIDDALNPPATQAFGQLFVEVGVQPPYPAEFIILRIGIWQGGSSVTES
jgi:phage tail sheath protein FI